MSKRWAILGGAVILAGLALAGMWQFLQSTAPTYHLPPAASRPAPATGAAAGAEEQAAFPTPAPTVEDPATGSILITPGPDTTRLPGPRNADHTINYVAALNASYGQDLDPQRNAAGLLLAVLPVTGNPALRQRLNEQLHLDPPAQPLVMMRTFLNPQADLSQDEDNNHTPDEQKFLNLTLELSRKLWSAQEQPQVARWVDANRDALDRLADAVSRKRFYIPFDSNRDPQALPKVSMPYLGPMREAARLFMLRATQRLTDGYIEGAMQDAITLFRLGRLLRQPPILLCQLMGSSIETMGSETTALIADQPAFTSAHAAAMIGWIQELNSWPTAARTDPLGERFMFLDAVQMAQREPTWGPASRDLFFRAPLQAPEKNTPPDDLPVTADYNAVLRGVNAVCDQAEKALAQPEFAAAQRALEILDSDTQPAQEQLILQLYDPAWVAAYRAAPAAERRRLMTPVLEAIITRPIAAVMLRRLRDDYTLRMKAGLAQVSLAAAAYYRDHHDFPQRLEELSPQYLATIPHDVFNGHSLYYVHRGRGVVIYSVGANLGDDGASADNARDIVLRMLPP